MLTVVAAVVISSGSVSFTATLGNSAAAATHPKPPVIAEGFSELPCDHKTTVGTEGCDEHQLVLADQRIDKEVALLFTLLHDDPARKHLSETQSAWLTYRRDDCLSQADIYEGGSEAPVVTLACEVNDDTARSTDLRIIFLGLEQGSDHVPKFP
jgi:uncharacterized protein YecT (DUF1311 family)